MHIALLLSLALLSVGACTSLSNRYRPTSTLTVAEDVSYVAGIDHPSQRMDVFRPPGEGPFPVIVFVHGGWWHTQSKSYYEPVVGLYRNVGIALAEHGIASAIIGYRYHPEVDVHGMLDDVAAAVREVRRHGDDWHLDLSRLYVGGHSAGAHLATTLVHKPGELTSRQLDGTIAGVIALGGPYDVEESQRRAPPEHAVHAAVFGADDPGQWSPLRHVTRESTRTMFMAGTDDFPVCRESFFAMRERIGVGSRHWFVELPVDHSDTVIWMGTHDDQVTPQIAAFIGTTRLAR
jgi:alpha/beta hydrolase fold